MSLFKSKTLMITGGTGSFVNVVLNAIFIPNIGINEAAFATLITQITTSMLAPCFLKKLEFIRR